MIELDEAAAKLKPLHGRVVMQRLDAESTSEGGIVIPDVAKEKRTRGMILGLGQGPLVDGKRTEFFVKRGDEVIFSHYAGTEIKVDGHELMIVEESDIVAVIAS